MLKSTTDEITAWSTFAAVVVALSVALGPRVLSRINGPRLRLTVGIEAPHRIATWTRGFVDEGSELRLEVRNKSGRMPARNVRVRLQSMWIPIVDGQYEWGDMAIDIVPLQWSSRRFADGRAGLDSDVTDIPGGISDFAEFIYWDRKEGTFEVRDSRRPADDHSGIRIGKGSSFRCQLVVSADHMKPIVRVVKVAGGEDLDQLEFSEPPPADKTKIWSIVNFIQDLRRDHPQFGAGDGLPGQDGSPDSPSPGAGSADVAVNEIDTSEESLPDTAPVSAPESSP
jgi:hypothetical protein